MSETDVVKMYDAVGRGIRWLNRHHYPHWMAHVDVDKLDQLVAHRCVLAQVLGHHRGLNPEPMNLDTYQQIKRRLRHPGFFGFFGFRRVSDRWMRRHGFELKSSSWEDWHRLTAIWKLRLGDELCHER